jgi:hypothetical protein
MRTLRRLGLLVGGRAVLHPAAYQFMQPEYDCLTDGLRHLLGVDLSGPAWCVCRCRECSNKASDIEHTRLSDEYRSQTVDAIVAGVMRH